MNRARTTNSFPLTFAERDETVVLVEIHAGGRLHKRLGDLGLRVGMRVRVVQGNTGGPLILAIQDEARLAVGRGMAQKITVKHAEENH